MPDEIVPAVEPSQTLPVATIPDAPAPIESVLDKVLWVEDTYKGAVAQHANEVWIRNEETGRWDVQSGTVKQRILEKFEKGIPATLWDGLGIHLAVDPNNTGESVFYSKRAGKRWRPYSVPTNEVCCSKGYYDLRARQFTPFEKEELVFGPLVDCQPDESILAATRAGNWSTAPEQFRELMKMVDFALGGEADTIRYFQQVIAQVLRPHCGFNHFVHVYGQSGARKTTIMRALLSAPCGRDGCSEISEEVLAEQRFSRIGLVNRVANLSNDSANSRRFSTFIKEVTSGVLMVEKKFHDCAKVKLTAKLFATMNAPQDYTDHSLGVENRLITFKFAERTDNNRSAEGMQWMDPKFIQKETRAWINHWLLVGLESLFDANGRERAPEPSAAALAWKNELLDESSPVRAFVQSEVVADKKAETLVQDVVDRAVEMHFMEPGDETFKVALGKHLAQRFKIDRKYLRSAEKRHWYYTGIALRTKME